MLNYIVNRLRLIHKHTLITQKVFYYIKVEKYKLHWQYFEAVRNFSISAYCVQILALNKSSQSD